MFTKLFKATLLTLLAYLLQATTAIHLSVWDIAPNIALSLIAIVSVAMGRKYTFFMSLTICYFLELMLPALLFFTSNCRLRKRKTLKPAKRGLQCSTNRILYTPYFTG